MDSITGYQFYGDFLVVTTSTGRTLRIYFNENSGKIYYRHKLVTPKWIKHTGIFVGTDGNGSEWWIHNHIDSGKAVLTTGENFKQGLTIYKHDVACSNTWDVVIEKGLGHIMNGEEYKLLTYNCQTMTTDSCQNVRKSEDADKIIGGVALGLLVVGLFAAFSGDE